MTSPMPEISTHIFQNTNGTAGSMYPLSGSVYRPLPVGVTTLTLSWAGGYDIDVLYNTHASTSGAYVVGSFTGEVESQTETIEIANDSSTGRFYIRSKNTSSGNVDKPLGVMVTSWPA